MSMGEIVPIATAVTKSMERVPMGIRRTVMMDKDIVKFAPMDNIGHGDGLAEHQRVDHAVDLASTIIGKPGHKNVLIAVLVIRSYIMIEKDNLSRIIPYPSIERRPRRHMINHDIFRHGGKIQPLQQRIDV